jgi:uncharacterized protein (TIGR04255 family)
MIPQRRRIERLPKAPLAEVVFELRWKLQGPPETPPIIKVDPGFLPLLESFTTGIKKIGFGTAKDMSPPLQTGAYGVARRFFKSPDSAFPIMQVGPGIFATNESSQYEWKAFKSQVKAGLRVLLDSYPKLGVFKLEPSMFELRYIDAFDKSLLGKAAFLDFLERGTSMKFELPKILTDRELFAGDAEGRFIFARDLKGWKNSRFIMDIGSGKSGDEEVVRLETKVQCEDAGVPGLTMPARFMRETETWLNFAHGITSPFFKQFVLPHVMRKFEET